jgi:hypothetical protein
MPLIMAQAKTLPAPCAIDRKSTNPKQHNSTRAIWVVKKARALAVQHQNFAIVINLLRAPVGGQLRFKNFLLGPGAG